MAVDSKRDVRDVANKLGELFVVAVAQRRRKLDSAAARVEGPQLRRRNGRSDLSKKWIVDHKIPTQSRLEPNDLAGVAETRRNVADSDLLLGRHADRFAVFEDGAVFKQVVHDIEKPFAKFAGLHVDSRNFDLHVPQRREAGRKERS